jgi:hypothetical protein
VVSLTPSRHSAEALNNRHMHQTNHKKFTKYEYRAREVYTTTLRTCTALAHRALVGLE